MHRFNALRFETTPDGMVAGGGLTPDGVPDGMPDPEPVQEGPSVEDQLAEFQQVIAEQQAMLEKLAPVADAWQQIPGPQDNGQPPQMPSPFEDDYGPKMEAYLEYRDAQRLGPYQEVMQQQRMEQLENTARDMIHDVVQSKGELLSPQYGEGQQGITPEDMILEFAKSYSPQMVAQYGEGVRADEAAIEAAYEDVKTLQDAWLAAAEARQSNQLNALRQAPREPGSSGVAAQPAVTTVAGGWEAFKARHGLE